MKESDIRPASLFDEYLRLAALDAAELFDTNDRQSIDCPACCQSGDLWFEKETFQYRRCLDCHTIFASHRPSDDQLRRYYPKSCSAEVLDRHGTPDHRVIDIGGGYGIFDEVAKELMGWDVLLIEPSPGLSEVSRGRGLQVIESFLEDVQPSDLPDGPRIFTSFELLEHLNNPVEFVATIQSLMKDGDLLVMTSLSSHGIDILPS